MAAWVSAPVEKATCDGAVLCCMCAVCDACHALCQHVSALPVCAPPAAGLLAGRPLAAEQVWVVGWVASAPLAAGTVWVGVGWVVAAPLAAAGACQCGA
jgi:hypothetical protein